jgi:gliding motility-associated-like protein
MRRVGYFSMPLGLCRLVLLWTIFLLLPSQRAKADGKIYNRGGVDFSVLTATVSTTPVSYEKILSSFTDSADKLSYNGSITVVAHGGTGPYSYTLLNPFRNQVNGSFTGLAPGSYTVKITDFTGQFISKTVTVSSVFPQPQITLSDTVYPSSCSSFDGSFTLTGSGGTPPYQYSIDGGATFNRTGVFTGLAQGYYTVLLVKDANGFLAATGFNTALTGQDFSCRCCKIILLAILDDASPCDNNGGKITVEGINPAPLSYSLDQVHYFDGVGKPLIDGGIEYEYTFGGLPHGFTTIYARDKFGNKAVACFPVIKSCNMLLSSSSSNASCNHKDGSITVNVLKGTAPFTYSADGIHYQTSNIFKGLGSGNYNILVKDSEEAINSVQVQIEDDCPLIQATVSVGTCGKNGEISVSGDQGTPPYQYSLNGVDFQTDSNFTGLNSGEYVITIKDANALSNTDTVSIFNADPPLIKFITTTASCDNDGTISAAGTSGSLPLQFSLDSLPFQRAPLFKNISGGLHTLQVKDFNGCLSSQDLTVPLVNVLQVNAGSDRTVCEGVVTSIDASSNATLFAWTPTTGIKDPAILKAEVSPAFTTTYTLTASKGACTATDSVIIQIKPAPLADAGPDTVICFGDDIQLLGSGGLTCQWFPTDYLSDARSFNPVVQNPQRSVIYHLIVTDGEGCSSILNAAVDVHVTPTPKVSAGEDSSSGYNQTVQLMARDINNSGFFQYTWTPSVGLSNPFIANPVASISGDMVYTVNATAPGGCTSSDEIRIKLYPGPAIYVPSGFTPNGDGKNDILKTRPIGIRSFTYFSVYNRLGQRVFYSNDPGSGWDGTLNGMPQESGGFIWMAEGIDINGKTIHRQGTVLLIR